MNMKSNLKGSLSQPKTRIFFFFMLGIVIVLGFFVFSAPKTIEAPEEQGVQARSKIQDIGADVESISGISEPSAEYLELQTSEEKKKAEAALAAGGQPSAALPSLTLGADINIDEVNKQPQTYRAQKTQDLSQQRDIQEQLFRREQEAKIETSQQDKNVQKLLAAQAKVMAKNWQVVPQSFIVGDPVVVPDTKRQIYLLNAIRGKEEEKELPKIYYKAGDILFGVILTGVNSDEPGPVLARIISGPLANAKIIGAINPASIPKSGSAPKVSKSLILEFKLLNIPGMKKSVAVTAVAIDPQTARTSLATDVDNHYLLRYGTFFASKFLAGLGDAVSQQNTSNVITDLGAQVKVGSSQLNTQDEIKIAIGETAKALSDSVNFIDIPPTIKIASGTAVGLLLQKDLVIGGNEDTDVTDLLSQNMPSAGASNPPVSTGKGSTSTLYGAPGG